MLEGELVYQQGYLGLPFHRVYFADNSVHVENLPSTRLKIPLGIRANYFIGDKFILRTWYRNYHDDWGINSNTVQVETVVKLTPFFSVTPFIDFTSKVPLIILHHYMAHPRLTHIIPAIMTCQNSTAISLGPAFVLHRLQGFQYTTF